MDDKFFFDVEILSYEKIIKETIGYVQKNFRDTELYINLSNLYNFEGLIDEINLMKSAHDIKLLKDFPNKETQSDKERRDVVQLEEERRKIIQLTTFFTDLDTYIKQENKHMIITLINNFKFY